VSIPAYTYTVLPDGRVKVVNFRGQVAYFTRAQIEKALQWDLITPEQKKKYQGALNALESKQAETQHA
jgi:hypothetical protein